MKIKIIPHPSHISAVKALYGKEVEAESLPIEIETDVGPINLQSNEYEIIKKGA